MTTKLAHILGPAMVATAAMLTDEPRWILLVLMPLFLAGAFMLALVREQPVSA
jgi:MFS-type transporter involved in bile tolerance (Atg22 family)